MRLVREKYVHSCVVFHTCVRIWHATMMILRDCSGRLQVAVVSVSLSSRFVDIPFLEIIPRVSVLKARTAKRLPTTITTVPVKVPEHLMHRKSDVPMYPSSQTEHTVLGSRPSHRQSQKSCQKHKTEPETVRGEDGYPRGSTSWSRLERCDGLLGRNQSPVFELKPR